VGFIKDHSIGYGVTSMRYRAAPGQAYPRGPGRA